MAEPYLQVVSTNGMTKDEYFEFLNIPYYTNDIDIGDGPKERKYGDITHFKLIPILEVEGPSEIPPLDESVLVIWADREEPNLDEIRAAYKDDGLDDDEEEEA